MKLNWSVYILECIDGTYYTGSSNNVERRIIEHNTNNSLGAKYTKTRRPIKLIYSKHIGSRGDALKEELRIKRLSKKYKIRLITGR